MENAPNSRLQAWKNRLKQALHLLRRASPFIATVLVTLGMVAGYGALSPKPHLVSTEDVNNIVQSVMASATPAPAYSVGVYQAIMPSLVLIESEMPSTDGKQEESLGTGVIIDDQGDILTAAHVVANALSIKLTFSDGTQSVGTVANITPENDIAVLQAATPPAQIVPAVLGNPNAMQVGDEAYAVGNPFGLYASMSSGIISGFNRTFQPVNSDQKISGLIQIDTAVNPGNSGGPLLNRYGQVIGIVEGIVNPTGQSVFIGIGFAVPINTAGGALGGSPPD